MYFRARGEGRAWERIEGIGIVKGEGKRGRKRDEGERG